MLARVPWVKPLKIAKPKPKKITRDRRRHLVNTVADVLKTGEPTRFALEASCRSGLRAGFCLEGWNWQEADATAAEIVAAALHMIGAKRPTWQQGQPEWTQHGVVAEERTTCIRCKGELPEGHYKYCGNLCAQAAKQARMRERRKDELLAYQRARYAAGKLHPIQPPRPCETCGKEFRPRKKTARFCSGSCSNRRANHGWR